MNPEIEIERELGAAFSELRQEARRSMPPYADLRDAALASGSARKGWGAVRWAAAAAGLGAIALAVVFVTRVGDETDPLAREIALAEEMAAWTAPTDALYALSSFEVPATVPGLDLGSAYVLDIFPGGSELSRDASEAE